LGESDIKKKGENEEGAGECFFHSLRGLKKN
jgi:hypothetical protein